MPIPLAVAGLGCRLPGCADARALADRLRTGAQSSGALPRREGETPGAALRRATAAAAAEAWADARLTAPRALALLIAPGDEDAATLAAVLAATDASPKAARRVPTLLHALRAAREALSRGEADAVLLLAGHGDPEAAAHAGPFSGPFSVAFEAGGVAPPPSEGAAAVVLVDERRHGRGRARLCTLAEGAGAHAQGLREALDAALAAAGWRAGDVGLVALDGRREAMVAEAAALSRAFREPPRGAALMGVRALAGDAGPASDLAALAAMALCCERATLPPLPGWRGPGPAALAGAEGLCALEAPLFWAAEPGRTRRRGLLSLRAGEAGAAVLAVEAGPALAAAGATALCEGRPMLFPLAAPDRAGIEAALGALDAACAAGEPLPALARAAIGRARAGMPLRMAVVAATPGELRRETGFMRRALDKAAASGEPVRTPGGSVVAPAPLAARGGRLAFVYPGNGSAYVGLGRQFLVSFAGRAAAAEPAFDHRVPELMRLPLVHPRGLAPLSEAQEAALAQRLRDDMASLPLVGVAFGIWHTRILRSLRLRPDMALGYSIGECTMRAALGQWRDWRALERLLHHPALLEGVSGPMREVRRFWAEAAPGPRPVPRPDEAPWAAHYVKASAADLAPLLDGARDVFVQSVLSPEETIVAGSPRGCAEALARSGAMSLPLDFDIAIHTPPARRIRAALEALCDVPLEPLPGVALLSAQAEGPVPQTRSATARTLARMFTEPVDFRALVERAYADGARVFVEVGVRNACTGWIGACLAGREHLAVALDVKGLPSDAAWMRAVALLYAHHVPLDLGALAEAGLAPPQALAHPAQEFA